MVLDSARDPTMRLAGIRYTSWFMLLTVLGSNGTYPSPESPASGYLVTHGGVSIWMDAGSGTFAALCALVDPQSIDAIVLTHAHADHCMDALAFYYATKYGRGEFDPVPVFAPASVEERLAAFLGPGHQSFDTVFDFIAVEEGSRATVGEMVLTFAEADHPVPTVAVRLEAEGRSLAYSSDTGPEGSVARLAQNADMFLVEATYQGTEKPWRHHLSAYEAGTMGAEAGAKALVLTHIWPELDFEVSRHEAATTFGSLPQHATAGRVFKV